MGSVDKPLVLITGATGHIGFRTLAKLLEAGYRARVSSRKLASAEALKDLPSIKPYADAISFIEIPDFFAPDAFASAVKDVEYIMHIASPIPDPAQTGTTFDGHATYIAPAIEGNLGILRAAHASPSVKRVVITSSVAILDRDRTARAVGPDDLAPIPDVDNLPPNPWAVYRASKILANAAAESWVRDNKPAFEVVHILPSYAQGRNEPLRTSAALATTVSSNETMVQYVLGRKEQEPRPADLVLVDDVADVHVAALTKEGVVSGERFVAAYSPPIVWKEVDDIVRRLFPDEVKSGILPLGGTLEFAGGAEYDTSKTTEKLGVVFKGHEEMVRSLIGQYVELVKKEKEL